MLKSFNKTSFESDLGYEITCTTGLSAENSTISYPHQTPRFMLYFFIHGSGNIKIEGKNYRINDGDIIILNPSEMFCCSVDANKYHERIVLHITDSLLKHFPKDCSALYSPFLNRKKGVSNHISSETVKKYGLDNVMKRLHMTVHSNNPCKEILTLCKIMELFSILYEIFEEPDSQSTVNSTENPIINNVLEFLNFHFKEDLSIDSIAEKFNIDKSYLSHLFKNYVGISVWNYVIFRRISYFNSIVIKGISIEEASRLAGFNNYSNFFRLYKKHTGITPTKYRIGIRK